MILLDTDHLSILTHTDNPRCETLRTRLRASGDTEIGVPAPCVEEQLRGWLARINKAAEPDTQVFGYDQLLASIKFLASWNLVRFDERAAEELRRLRASRIRIGTQDLKIAAIALVHDALLLTANARDFRKVPGLRWGNWLAT